MNTDLVYAIQERNVMAHRIFDNGEINEVYPTEKGTVRFAKIKNIIEPLDYNDAKYLELMVVIKDLTIHFRGKIPTIE